MPAIFRPLTLAFFALAAACAPEVQEAAKAEKATATWVLECAGTGRIVAREVPGKIWLFLPGETRELPQGPAASGTRYTDGEWTAWAKGRDVMILKGEERQQCISDPAAAVWEHAKLNGVDFRAIGNEPGWLLEISQKEKLHLEADYGALIIDTPLPPFAQTPDGDAARYVVETDDHKILIELSPEACTDAMSGEVFASSVTVTLDGRELKGCGKALH